MQYTYKRKNPDTGEETIEDVVLRRWVWTATYEDGTELHQYDDDGTFHQMGEIDQKRLRFFTLYRSDNPQKRIDMPITAGMKVFLTYKNVKAYYLENEVMVYCLGYKNGPHRSFVFILPDDRMIFANKENVDLPTYQLTYPEQHGNKA